LCLDTHQLEQAFMNLLDNACKFTPRFGSIEIRGYPFFWERRLPNVALDFSSDRREQQVWAPNSYRIDIRDSGPGVHPDHLDAIFEEYTLYPAGQDRSGGGLGLAVCKMIVDQHNGRIWAENGPNGAVFSVVLPFYNAAQSNGSGIPPSHAGAL
jgi:signal transduction histidine kinase